MNQPAPKPTQVRIHRFTFSLDELRQQPIERRTALLLVGLLLNEVNWLRKLLTWAVEVLDCSPNQAHANTTLANSSPRDIVRQDL